MSDFNPNNPADDFDGDELGGVAWNEFDWEQYLRGQDDVVVRYLGFYEMLSADPERLEKAAHCMGWNTKADDDEDESQFAATREFLSQDNSSTSPDSSAVSDMDSEPYTVHKNAVFVATRAIYLSVTRMWESIAIKSNRVPQVVAVNYLASLNRGEFNAMLAVHALDYGDYAMAVSLFKRALAELNRSFALLDEKTTAYSAALTEYRSKVMPRLFDLRNLWWQMICECRSEIESYNDSNADDE